MTARNEPREDVAAMLRDGATYRAIEETLGVSRYTIAATRRRLNIPNTATGSGRRITPEDRPAIERRVVELARAGATYRQIQDEAGVTHPTIAAIRRKHGLPKPVRQPPPNPQRRSIAEAFALHARPDDDGHTHWTGPHAGRLPTLNAENSTHNARHIAFRMHHGRDPHGRVHSTCTVDRCLTGAHLTDHTIRQQLDTLYDAIFGSEQ